MPSDWFFLDDAEQKTVSDVLDVVDRASEDEAAILRASLDILARSAEIVRASPSITRTWTSGTGRSVRPIEALIDLLCRVPDYDLDLHVPTKAVLGQSYLIAKINFFKALRYALRDVDGVDELLDRVDAELAQSVYSKLAEELFVSIVTDPDGKSDGKLRAARLLFRIWEERLLLEVDDFAPLLEAVWQARNRLRPVLGSMLGTTELFRLFRESRGDEFLEYFGSDDVPEEQLLAFEEFLFGLSYEEIQRLRSHLGDRAEKVISAEQARELLGRSKASWAPTDDGPTALYTSYKKRRVKAHYRALTGAKGPKKTAEEYVMTAFLERSDKTVG